MTLIDPMAVDADGTRAPAGRASLASIQVMRGLAAAAVVIYHVHLILSQPRYGAIDVMGWITSKGWTGVNFFFVLSGFIIPYAHYADIGRPARAGRYLMRRITRVYPIYWIVLTAFVAVSAAGLGQSDFEWSFGNLLSAYLLMQVIPVPTLPLRVAWTLVYEVFFYGMFLLLILNRRFGATVIGIWLAIVLVWGLVLNHDTSFWYLHSWNLYFAMGAIGYLAYRRFEGRDGLPVLAVGLVLLAVMAGFGLVDQPLGIAQTHPRTLLLLAPPFALILVGAALADRRRDWRPGAALALLGEASYSIYLVHSPVVSTLALVNLKLARHAVIQPHLLYLLVTIIAIGAGIMLHLLIERPLLRAIRRVVGERSRSSSGAVPTTTFTVEKP